MDTSNMSLMEIFSNPETIHTLSFGAKMQASLITMIMGLGITFAVLILIWIFIAIMGKIMEKADKKPGSTCSSCTCTRSGDTCT